MPFAIRFVQALSIGLGVATFLRGAIVGFYGLYHGILGQSLVSLFSGLIALLIGVSVALFVGRFEMKKKRKHGR